MSRTICKSNKPLFLNIFPSWKGRQPLRFFMMENLLEARNGSGFPTNGAGFDEDVNVFLAGLLTGFLGGDHHPQVVCGIGSLLQPPDPQLGRRQQAEYYLANARHRLLHLGLLDRGDGLRRRRVPFGLSAEGSRQRDLAVGRNGFLMAANLLRGRNLVSSGLVAVYEKLGRNFTDYVQVLTVLATRRLGLGAHLSPTDLQRLLAGDDGHAAQQCPPPAAPADSAAMDRLLDLVLEYGRHPEGRLEEEIARAAARAGADAQKILSGLRRT